MEQTLQRLRIAILGHRVTTPTRSRTREIVEVEIGKGENPEKGEQNERTAGPGSDGFVALFAGLITRQTQRAKTRNREDGPNNDGIPEERDANYPEHDDTRQKRR